MQKVKKRNGKIVDYDDHKILEAVRKANRDSKDAKMTIPELYDIVRRVEVKLDSIAVPNVERVQDAVEDVLMNNSRQATAKAYIIYRAEHAKARDAQAGLMEKFMDLTFKPAEEMESRRDNANIDTNTPMGTMLKYGTESSNYFNDNFIIPKKYVDAHRSGRIHIHDKDFQNLTFNCLQIDLPKLLHGGFSTGHGFIREPQSIRSYAALACIAIQSSQNDMYGGQSICTFDYAMAEGVRKSFRKLFISSFEELIEIEDVPEGTIDKLRSLTLPTYLNESAIPQLINDLGGNKFSKLVNATYRVACRRIVKETYQAMESVIHNLNSMHCLPYSEKIWVLDVVDNELKLMKIGELDDRFEKNRYKAISLNQKTGKAEFKFITASQRKDNKRRLIKINAKSGATVTTTDNHKVMFLGNNGRICEDIPERIPHIISPRSIDFPLTNNDICLEHYESRRQSNYAQNHIAVTVDFAKLAGYYVAEGSTCGGGTLSFTTCNVEKEKELITLMQNVYGENITYRTYPMPDGIRPKDIRFNVGKKWHDMFRDKFGHNASGKKIPTEILFADDDVKRAFLNGYLKCDGCVKDRYIDASTVSETLRSQLQLIMLSMNELPYVSDHEGSKFYSENSKHAFVIGFNSNTENRLGLEFNTEKVRCEVKSYNFDFLYDSLYRDFVGRKPKRERICKQTIDFVAINDERFETASNVFPVPIDKIEELNSGDEYVYDISVEDNETFLTRDCIFVHNSRAGAQVPFSSINFGTDTSPEGRLVMEQFMLSEEKGLGHGETPIFPKMLGAHKAVTIVVVKNLVNL